MLEVRLQKRNNRVGKGRVSRGRAAKAEQQRRQSCGTSGGTGNAEPQRQSRREGAAETERQRQSGKVGGSRCTGCSRFGRAAEAAGDGGWGTKWQRAETWFLRVPIVCTVRLGSTKYSFNFLICVSSGIFLKSMAESCPLSKNEHITPNIDRVKASNIFYDTPTTLALHIIFFDE